MIAYICSFQDLEVYADGNLYAGSVIQEWSTSYPLFQLKDTNGHVTYRLKGPASAASCCGSNYQARFDVSIIYNLNYRFKL
jgi:hypothetical protein